MGWAVPLGGHLPPDPGWTCPHDSWDEPLLLGEATACWKCDPWALRRPELATWRRVAPGPRTLPAHVPDVSHPGGPAQPRRQVISVHVPSDCSCARDPKGQRPAEPERSRKREQQESTIRSHDLCSSSLSGGRYPQGGLV